MPRNFRHRSSSLGSQSESTTINHDPEKPTMTAQDVETAKRLLSSLMYIKDDYGRSFLHTQFPLCWAKALLDRAKCLDEFHHFEKTTNLGSGNQSRQSKTIHKHTSPSALLQRRFLLQPDQESGYTPLHRAIMERNLPAILLFLRHGMSMDAASTERLTQRPITVLHASSSRSNAGDPTHQSNSNLLHLMATATDKEGLTPLQLMGQLQRSELRNCREALESHQLQVDRRATTRLRPRQTSFGGHDDQNQDDGVDFFSGNGDLLQRGDDGDSDGENNGARESAIEHACEVVTFGRPGHYALGVVQGVSTSATTNESSQYSHAASTFSTQRVQEFAQERVGREGAAVAVAAATHHTLVVTKNGHLFSFGLGKGGRLGLGEDHTQQCPLPQRVLGPLNRRLVVHVAAAENHSLCVTRDGSVFAWGSNRFGQLGDSGSAASAASRSVPRRVDDMKQYPCVAVAAGERHSVALTRKGEVYVWGDNTCGQLGVPRRSGIQKVQRVEALWKSSTAQGNKPKIAIAIAAADQSTLVLAAVSTGGLANVNSIYEWGHGNHVPIRVHIENWRSKPSEGSDENQRFASGSKRFVNPIAIACGKYHNAAITSDGLVYTWGLHAESLGRSNSGQSAKQQQRRNTLPQIVSGLLPENGGGLAVAIAASDHRTAVVCENGALYTWGTTDGKNVLGHEGVRWQHFPRQVPGVHRAVNVAIGKEHTILLIGASFPSIPKEERLLGLDLIAARTAARHVDLFNVIPISIMAERAECDFLTNYCSDFIQRNLDGVLNMGKKSVLNQYLNDMLADTMHRSGKRYRDGYHHPFIYDVLSIGNEGRPSFRRHLVSRLEEWALGCGWLAKLSSVQKLLDLASTVEYEEEISSVQSKKRRSTSCGTEGEERKERARSLSEGSELVKPVAVGKREGSLDVCIKRTAKMDLSTSQLANENSVWLSKEIRGVRKKLKQISHLLETESQSVVLTTEQRAKVDRQPALEAELSVYESALEEVKLRIQELHEETSENKISASEKHDGSVTKSRGDSKVSFGENIQYEELKKTSRKEEHPEDHDAEKVKSFFCDVCNVRCSDESNLILHQNGRKHRNRCAQVAEEDEKKTAALILQHQQQVQTKTPSVVVPPTQTPKKNVWGVSATPPKFTLPPPPHAPFPQVAAKKQSPWETNDRSWKGSLVSPTIASLDSNFQRMLTENKKTKTAHRNTTKDHRTSPVWDSFPVSSRCVPLFLYEAPDVNSVGHRNSISIGDFLTPDKASPAKQVSPAAPWQSPSAAKLPSGKTMLQIQEEEARLKAREDKSSGSKGGRWYVERRERAGSLLEIQKVAEAEEEERLLIEEQYRIEAQIMEKNQKLNEERERQKAKIGPKRRPKKPHRKIGQKPRKSSDTCADTNNSKDTSKTNLKAQL